MQRQIIHQWLSRQAGLPSWRLLAGLAILVAAAHWLVLQAAPAQLGTRLAPELMRVKTFATRSIEAPSPPPALSPAPARRLSPVKPPRPPKKPFLQPKRAVSPVNINNVATNIVATEALPGVVVNAAPADDQPAVPAPTPENSAALTPITPQTPPAPPAPPTPTGPQTTPVTAISLPGSVQLKYKVMGTSKGLNYVANAELAWQSNGTQYDASMKVSAFLIGSRTMTSTGLITPIGLAPTRFADKFKSELAAHFDAGNGKISFSANTPDAPWFEGAQDRVSVFLQLGGMLAGKPVDFPVGSSITLYTIGPREADTWTFTVEAEEKLQLPAGEMDTLKLSRKPRREFDQKVEIWYAPSLGYLPVRNRITQQSGDFIDQQLTEVLKP